MGFAACRHVTSVKTHDWPDTCSEHVFCLSFFLKTRLNQVGRVHDTRNVQRPFNAVAFVGARSWRVRSSCLAYRKCQAEDFRCEVNGAGSGPCLPKSKRCDGYFDCRNHKDEENCGSAVNVSCPLDRFRCQNGQKCIDPKLKCDHQNNCGDNSDEENCSKYNGIINRLWSPRSLRRPQSSKGKIPMQFANSPVKLIAFDKL